jgi:NitT/TauT family transport system substrate-binding protein
MPMGKLHLRGSLILLAGVVLLTGLGLAGCGGDSSASPSGTTTTSAGGGAAGPLEGRIRLGFLANVTHAPVMVGLEEGLFAKALGSGVEIETSTFDSGTEAVEALLGGSLDLAYLGPNPAISAWQQSNGKAIRIIAGSTSGGASLVVSKEITKAADLAGKTLASPKLGNTQDVALRSWLRDQGFETDIEGGGDVSIQPQDNAVALDAFKSGQIDGAWEPEPWATRLVQEGGGRVLVDERDLWPGGRFVTTHLIASTGFLSDHADLVKAFLEGHVAAVDAANEDPARAQVDVARQIADFTGQEVGTEVIAASWPQMSFTVDPIATSLQTSADNAEAVGLLEPVDLKGIYDLRLLDEVRKARGEAAVPEALT